MYKILALWGFMIVFFAAQAQPEFGLHFLNKTAQSSKTNPAFIAQKGLVVTLPNLYNHLEITGPTFGELVSKNADGEYRFDIETAIDKLEATNQIRENFDIETVGVVFGLGGLRFQVHHAVRFGAYFEYPKELAQLIWRGNAQFIGQTIPLDNDLQVAGFNEFGLGSSIKLSKLTLGARVKLLTGIGDASSERNRASLHTSDDVYQLTFDADYRANTSSYLEYNGFDDTRADFNFGQFEFDRLFTENSGFAFDLGASLELGKLRLAASAIDLGKINWSENVSNYTSNGSFTYEGLDFSDALTGDSITIGDALDTLAQIFEVVETSEKYSTSLPSKYYLSAAYQLNEGLLLGAAYYMEQYRDQTFSGFSLNAQASLLKWLSAGIGYGIYRENYANIGLNLLLKFGPVQLLAASDNVLAVIQPDKSNFGNFRLGMNLVFGKQDED
ncbi:MAG TPA: DUF5723 family protein [Saprospiraceae bacterium]|nr:DUF5723 family protein [Saprospiraceae bacterium]